jgi:hypothetical protein
MLTLEGALQLLSGWRDAPRRVAEAAADAALAAAGLGAVQPPPLRGLFDDPAEVEAAAPRNTLRLAGIAFAVLIAGQALNSLLGALAAAARQRVVTHDAAAGARQDAAASAAAEAAAAKARRRSRTCTLACVPC